MFSPCSTTQPHCGEFAQDFAKLLRSVMDDVVDTGPVGVSGESYHISAGFLPFLAYKSSSRRTGQMGKMTDKFLSTAR